MAIGDDSVAGARHAAGGNPAKRRAILDGAKAVFFGQGFDAASVSDICRAAGVSKSTLYVYFDGKEDLFAAMVETERARVFDGLTALLAEDRPAAAILEDYGRALAGILCSDQVVRAQRIIIGIAERMPELGARFYAGGAMRSHADLAVFLGRETAAGRLAIPDVPLAAAQFVDLAVASLWKPRLFGKASAPPEPAEIDAAVASAVALFLAAYSAPRDGD